ncbi:MAG TPA: hypothetical protein VHK27_13305, partial [Gammaproteobacteria bacterium]|nr:hypothetical protein [Gammaproteobacteria bacterium]
PGTESHGGHLVSQLAKSRRTELSAPAMMHETGKLGLVDFFRGFSPGARNYSGNVTRLID